MQVSLGAWSWSFKKHPSWKAEKDEYGLTLTRSNEGGAFTLGSALKNGGVVTAENIDFCIRGWTEKIEEEYSPPESVTLGAFAGTHFSATTAINGNFWSWWVLGCGPVLLRATYNGPHAHAASELVQVETMLGTLAAVDRYAQGKPLRRQLTSALGKTSRTLIVPFDPQLHRNHMTEVDCPASVRHVLIVSSGKFQLEFLSQAQLQAAIRYFRAPSGSTRRSAGGGSHWEFQPWQSRLPAGINNAHNRGKMLAALESASGLASDYLP